MRKYKNHILTGLYSGVIYVLAVCVLYEITELTVGILCGVLIPCLYLGWSVQDTIQEFISSKKGE